MRGVHLRLRVTTTAGARIIGTRDAGATWQVFKVPARHEAPIAVACVRSRCIGSDYSESGNPIIVAGHA